MNKIVTRGFGPKRATVGLVGLVVFGYGASVTSVVEQAGRPLRLRAGQSGSKRTQRRLDTVVVWAKLVHVCHAEPRVSVTGWVRVSVDRDAQGVRALGEHVGSKIHDAWSAVRVRAFCVKRQP